MKKIFFFTLFTSLVSFSYAQNNLKVYPAHWWVGMKKDKVQLMIHEEAPDVILAVDKLVVKSSSSDLKIIKVNKVENRRYLFLDVSIASNAKPQTVTISFGGIISSEWRKLSFELKPRRTGNGTAFAQGVTSSDFIYLLMPDRFSNGDPANDSFSDMRDPVSNRNSPFDRHGGDLQGVINHLDYLKNLGVTSLWMTPVVENDMARTQEGGTSRSTYHGYAFTDHYRVDRRLGGNDIYKKLGDELHNRGMKLVQDAVYNHVGNDHWFIKDMPMKDWVNQWTTYTNTSYKDQPLVDPYAAEGDKKISVSGWFTPFLADLNQNNPYVANFLVQYAIWATQEFGVDGWRVDTYFYSDPKFLNRINTELINEFPRLTVFGEAWVTSVVNSAFFTQNNLSIPFKHNVQGVTDFPLFYSMLDGLNQPTGWSEGVNRVYATLTQDIIYKDPTRNCIFLDNHDLDRFYSVVGEDYDKFKMGMNWLLTVRGIPQLYYGTEILMKNFKNPSDAEVRRDFPGGWKEDNTNKFTPEGRTEGEKGAWQYIATLANFRKTSSALTSGKLMQYVPENGLYTYFRYSPKQTVMIISNTGTIASEVKMNRFEQRTAGFSKLKNVITGEEMLLKDFAINPKQSFVFELVK